MVGGRRTLARCWRSVVGEWRGGGPDRPQHGQPRAPRFLLGGWNARGGGGAARGAPAGPASPCCTATLSCPKNSVLFATLFFLSLEAGTLASAGCWALPPASSSDGSGVVGLSEPEERLPSDGPRTSSSSPPSTSESDSASVAMCFERLRRSAGLPFPLPPCAAFWLDFPRAAELPVADEQSLF